MASQATPISPESISTAVASLLKWLRHHPPPSSSGDFIYLILALHSIPHRGRPMSFSFPLPHSLYSSSICLIPNEPNNPLLSPSCPIKFSVILSLSELKSLYPSPESKRVLASSYDVFFADKRIVSRLPGILGKPFYGKKKNSKEPLVINFANPSWSKKANEILVSTKLFMKGGHCKGIKVARAEMSREEIIENVKTAINKAVECVPKKWNNVRSIHLKSTESIALPIYESGEGENGDANGEINLEETKVTQKRKVEENKMKNSGLKMVKKVKN